MKIVVLHGENSEKSFERFNQFILVAKKRGWEVRRLGESQRLPELAQAQSLFGIETLLIVEKVSKLLLQDLKWINIESKNFSGNLVIYHDQKLTKRILNMIPKPFKLEEYKLPKNIFEFLESFYPKNSREVILLLHQIVKKESPEFTFALLSKHIRDLYWVKTDFKSLPYPSWRIHKLVKLSERFTEAKLKKLLRELAKVDIDVKTSKATIVDSLDLISASLLE